MSDLMNTVQCIELFDIACAFTSNMERTATFALMPVHMAGMARRDQFIFDKVTVEAGHELNTLQLLSGERPPLGDQGNAEYRKLLINITSEEKNQVVGAGIKYVELLAHVGVPPVVTGLDALFASVVMESWTAFEVLCADTWRILVNHLPGEVRAKINASSSTNKKQPKEETNTTPKIDPMQDFGGAMIEADRVTFQTLPNIKENYRLAIGHDEVQRIFVQTGEGYVKALAAVRNLLAHKSGTVDGKFLEEVHHFSELSKREKNKRLELDGGLVAKLRMAAIECGSELLKKANSIITLRTTAP